MKFQSNSIFNGTITANSVADAGTNTDKFLVLNSGGVVTYRTAAELYADLGVGASSAAYTSVLKHPVKAGEAINKGQAVYVSSANGTNMIVTKASNTTEATSSKTMGLLETTLANNGIGNVVTEGLLAGLDTTGATNAGDPVWLGTSGNLIYGLANKPYAPAHLVFIGIVTRINANNGEIFVKVQNGFELREIHDVDLITTTPINGHILGYDGTLWVNKTIASWLGFTPVTNARTLTINGTGYDLSADRSWTINSMVYPSAGIAVSTGTAWGTSITDNSTNWNTAYTNRITSLTVTGSSGAATLVSNTLNIPTYTLVGLGGVPTSRSLTINGTAYDLSADRSWTIDSTSASTRTIQKFTATSGQTTFTITGGYAVGMVDVYMNGVKLDNATDFTASNGTTVVLATGALTNSIIEVYKFGSQFIPNNALRVVTPFTATAGQTSFTVTYSVGLVDVYYNGAKLAASEYTATTGTAIVLATAAQLNDIIEVIAYSYSVGAYSGIGGSGTSGQVPYFASSSAIASSPNHFWDATNNRLGIGTSSPLEQLNLMGANAYTSKIRFTNGASNTGYYTNFGYNSDGNKAYLQIADGAAASTIMTWNYNGNVGIGTSSPNGPLDVVGPTYDGKYTISLIDSAAVAADIGGGIYFGGNYSGTTKTGWAGIVGKKDNATSGEYGGYMAFYTRANGSAPAERMRIKSNGDLVIGTTPTANGHNFFMEGGNGAYQTIGHPNGTSTGYSYTLYYYNSGVLGGISQSGTTAVVYNTTSDYRLKEVISPIQNSIDTILKLKPILFKWKNTEDEYGEGFIAHELQEVVPLAVTGEKDAVNQDGSFKLQQVDHSKLVPHLVKAIQEMNTKIIELEKIVATR
jgi:hypothetical protein